MPVLLYRSNKGASTARASPLRYTESRRAHPRHPIGSSIDPAGDPPNILTDVSDLVIKTSAAFRRVAGIDHLLPACVQIRGLPSWIMVGLDWRV